MNLKCRLIPFFAVLLISVQLLAQNTGNSPYSAIGIGDLNHAGYIRNIGMGGTGISNGHPEFINIQNPALLPSNKTTNRDSSLRFTIFEAGLISQFRSLNTATVSQSSHGININYFSFAFPVSPNWTTSAGLRPYSGIQNRYVRSLSKQEISDANISNSNGSVILGGVTDYSIQGALNQVHLANGYDLSKKISLGLFAGYIFGNVTEETVTTATVIENNSGFNLSNSGIRYKTYYSAFELKPGIAYRTELKDSSGAGSGIYMNVAATFDCFVNFKGKQTRDLIVKDPYDGIGAVTNSSNTLYTTGQLPATTGAGISIDKPGKWTVAADFTYSSWSAFKSFESFTASKKMSNSYTMSLGGEIKPFKTTTLTSQEFRAGITYAKTPLTLYGRQLDDVSFSIGGSVPLGRKDPRYKAKPLTKINIALVVGKRGTTDFGLVKEQYFRIYFGALIHDRWFQRWRIE